MRALVLGSILLLAGCVAPGTSTPESADGANANVLAWGLTRCSYVVGWTPVEPEALRAYLPEGFEPGPFNGMLVGTPADRTILGVEAFVCEEGVGLNGTIPEMVYGSFWTSATPPAGLEDPDATTYTVRWDTLIPDADRRAVMAAAGMPARGGAASVESTITGFAGSYEMEDVGTTTMDMRVSRSPGTPEGGVVVEFTPTTDGRLAVWKAEYAWDSPISQGYGAITFPEGSWAAEVVGDTRGPGQFHAGTWTFSNATLTLPG